MSDFDLLQTYARTRSDTAFATLVARYLDLVYSAALRQVRSPHLAEDIAQSVFLDLARHAKKLRPGQPLAAWLFLVTRRTAIDAIRQESRRIQREHTATELAAMNTPSASWLQIKDRIDEALGALEDADRSVVLLRFFENRSLRDVGAAFGISDDTAQKRVSRALDRLRELLGRRGLTVGATVLAADLSAHAVHAAPSVLGSTITAAASASAALAGAGVKGVAASLLPKSVGAVAAAGVLGFVVFEAQALSQQRDELAAVRTQTNQRDAMLSALRTSTTAATQSIREAQAQRTLGAQLGATDPAIEAAIAAWLARLERLRALVARGTEYDIPELSILTEEDWFAAAREVRLETPGEIRTACLDLQARARKALANRFSTALVKYAAAHEGLLPTEVAGLAPYLPASLSPEVFARYEMLRTGSIDAQAGSQWLLAERLEILGPRKDRLFAARTVNGLDEPKAQP